MFGDIMSTKNNNFKYGRDVVTFVTNKIIPNKRIKNKKFDYPQKNCRWEKQHNMGEML